MKMITMRQAATKLKITRGRIHQIIAELEIVPAKIEGPFGREGFCYYLTPQQFTEISKKVRPKSK